MTSPATIVISWALLRLIQLPGGPLVTVGAVFFALGGVVVYLMAHSVTAEGVAAKIRPELMLAQTFALRPRHPEGRGAVA